MELAQFLSACPNCNGKIDDFRLQQGLPCKECLPKIPDFQKNHPDFRKMVAKELEKRGRLLGYAQLVELDSQTQEFISIFQKLTGSKPWSAQITWARRSMRGESFAIIAPTGVGKTTFLSVLATYFAMKNKRVLMIAPTALLARQIARWVKNNCEKMNVTLNVAEIHGEETESSKKASLKMVEEGSANIVVLTSMGLSRIFAKISKLEFDVALVDDVDSLLRRSVNIERVLNLLGFSSSVQEIAAQSVLARLKLARAFRQGLADSDETKTLLERYQTLKSEIEKYKLSRVKLGQLIVSSATARPRGLKVKLFRELLGFEAGSSSGYLRNIIDVCVYLETRTSESVLKSAVEWVKKLGKGGLVFVSKEFGKSFMEKLVERLREVGVKAYHTKGAFRKRVDEFAKGDVDVLIGTASYYGKLVRGIDLPESVRYTVFVGVPKFKTSLQDEEASPTGLIRLLYATADFITNPLERQKLFEQATKLRKLIQNLSPGDLSLVTKAIQEQTTLTGYLGKVQEEVGEGRKLFHMMLAQPGVLKKLKESDRLIIEEEESGFVVLTPDVKAYIQASGRSSRLLGGKLTLGLSVVLVDNERVMSALMRTMQIASSSTKWYTPTQNKRKLKEISTSESLTLEEVLKRIDADRTRKRTSPSEDLMKSALLIVESPNKARTIANFFGRPGRRFSEGRTFYEVMINGTLFTISSTGGHIVDLPHKASSRNNYGVPKTNNHFVPIYDFLNRCNSCSFQFTGVVEKCPNCGSNNLRRAYDVVQALRKAASDVSSVYVATDPDSEGEKIAWDIALLLSPYTSEIKRARFHEITPEAVLKAINGATQIDDRLVKAQIVRRIDDRWIGYGLTELLTKSQNQFFEEEKRRLRVPAGRVQIPVLGWIIQKSEQNKLSKVRKFRVVAKISLTEQFKVVFKKAYTAINGNIKQYIEELRKSKILVKQIETQDVELKAPPPFTTDTILEEASKSFGWSVEEIMRRLQDLFELGLITYHRTDHTHVSQTGIEIARVYLESTWKSEWQKLFKPRSWGEEGAHECIRPTKPLNADELKRQIDLLQIPGAEALDFRHIRLYDLIFRRFIASQMSNCKMRRQKAKLVLLDLETTLEGYSAVLEEGFNRVYPPRMVTPLQPGMEFEVLQVEHVVSSESPLPTEGEVVAYMKKKGIGRPSTYASTIERLKKHGYVFATKRNSLVATASGKTVYEFLAQKLDTLKSILDEEYTAALQKRLQKVETGEEDYSKVALECYNDYLKIRSLVMN